MFRTNGACGISSMSPESWSRDMLNVVCFGPELGLKASRCFQLCQERVGPHRRHSATELHIRLPVAEANAGPGHDRGLE